MAIQRKKKNSCALRNFSRFGIAVPSDRCPIASLLRRDGKERTHFGVPQHPAEVHQRDPRGVVDEKVIAIEDVGMDVVFRYVCITKLDNNRLFGLFSVGG